MIDIEKLLREAFSEMRRRGMVKPEGPCPTEEDLACFFDHKLTREEQDAFAWHLATCRPCFKRVSDLLAIEEAPELQSWPEVTPEMVEETKRLVSSLSKPSFLEIILNLTQDTIELVHTTGKLLSEALPSPVFRGAEKAHKGNQITVSEDFKAFALEVEVRKKSANASDITVRIKEKERAKAKEREDFRVSLLQSGRMLRSKLTEKGAAKFEDVETGDYEIVIKEEGRTFATVRLAIHPKP